MDFHISFTSSRQLHDFVALAARQPFDVFVGKDRNINGKDFLGMATLDFSRPVHVHADCPAEAFAAFRASAFALQK